MKTKTKLLISSFTFFSLFLISNISFNNGDQQRTTRAISSSTIQLDPPEKFIPPQKFDFLCSEQCPKFQPGKYFHLQPPKPTTKQQYLFCAKCNRKKINEPHKPLGVDPAISNDPDYTLILPPVSAFRIPSTYNVRNRFKRNSEFYSHRLKLNKVYNYRERFRSTRKFSMESTMKESLTATAFMRRWNWYRMQPGTTKYFRESKGHPGVQDIRYVVKLPKVKNGSIWMRETEIELIDAWMELAETNGILTWMAHGTLLSWYWGRNLFPWDKDADFQVAGYQLPELWRMNRTFTDNGRFFFDVNPNSAYRVIRKKDGNRIDARVIDTKTGLYLDITVISRYKHTLYSSCKSPHYYQYDDIFPLRPTVLEGVKVWRPNKVEKVLMREYKMKGLTIPHWRDGVTKNLTYYWDSSVLDWSLINPAGFGGSFGQNEGQPPQRKMQIKLP